MTEAVEVEVEVEVEVAAVMKHFLQKVCPFGDTLCWESQGQIKQSPEGLRVLVNEIIRNDLSSISVNSNA
ncbi:unnamed protein product [Boreogadus saida]